MNNFARLIAVVALCSTAPMALAQRSALPNVAQKLARLDPVTRQVVRTLPFEWQVVRTERVPESALGPIRTRFGAPFESLTNATFQVYGYSIKVNTFVTASEGEAKALHAKLLAFKRGNRNACARVGELVTEFYSPNPNLVRRAAWDIGLRPKPEAFRYRISFKAAPLAECRDYMKWHALFDVVRGGKKGDLDTLRESFRFGDRMSLRTAAKGDWRHRFTPSPVADRRVGDLVEYRFGKLPSHGGLPAVNVTAELVVRAKRPVGPKPGPALTKPTPFWPSDDAKLVALAKRITANAKTPDERVDALLAWFQPSRNLRYGGGVMGSRWGVKRVFEQRFGHCWDFADCFITLCRALHIPARLMAGWLFGGEGHVWAEVYLEGTGWKQVDPTGGGFLGCYPYHVGYITSEDGRLSLLYLDFPRIEFVDD